MSESLIKAIDVFRKHQGLLRMSEALECGISRRTLYAMRDRGIVESLSRGLYRLAELPALGSPDLVTVCARVPQGVLCLISALALHDLTTQIPHVVDVALPRGAEPPRIDYPPVHVYWFSGRAFTHGIETVSVDSRKVRVYSAEKSVADAFKYRNKIGMDVALEALRGWLAKPRANVELLLHSARVCRVERVMRPYLEALL